MRTRYLISHCSILDFTPIYIFFPFFFFSLSDTLRSLHEQAYTIQQFAYQDSTKRNMRSQLNTYLQFCHFYSLEPFPVTKCTFMPYLIFLSHRLSSYRSLQNYVSVLKHVNRALGLSSNFMHDYDCSLTQRALRRVLGDRVTQTLPITIEILVSLCRTLSNDNILHICMHAVFLVAFFSFLRVSNLLPYRYTDVASQDQLFLRRRDVKFSDQGCFLRVHKTKTVQFREQIFEIPLPRIPNSVVCPVTALQRYISLVPATSDNPLFELPNNLRLVPVLVNQFNSFLKRCISILGLEQRHFSSRSFRKGGATFAFNSGAPTELIKAQGTWKSNAYLVYLNLSPSNQLSLLSSITSKLANLK